jgi:hypothetical protein
MKILCTLIFYTFLPIWVKFSIEDLNIIPTSNWSLVKKIGIVQSTLYLWAYIQCCPSFYTFLPVWIKLGNVQKTLFTCCEFHKNHHREIQTPFRGVNAFLSVIPTFVSDLGEIRCKRSGQNAVEHFRVS